MKIYLRTEGNIEEQLNAYAKVFEGKILKQSVINKNDLSLNLKDPKDSLINFGYLTILNDINVLIAFHKPEMPTWGYSNDIVLSLDSKETYERIYKNLQESEFFGLEYDTLKQVWGTQICKWKDKWGYFWILETKI